MPTLLLSAVPLPRELRLETGRLLRPWQGGEAKVDGYLEDCSYLIEGLLKLYQTTQLASRSVAA